MEYTRVYRLKEHRNDRTVILIILMMTLHAIVRVATGTYATYQNSDTVYYQIGGNSIATYILYISAILAVLYGCLCCFKMKRTYTSYLLTIILCCLIVTIWILVDSFDYSLSAILREQGASPFTFFLMICIFIGTNNKAWETVVRMSQLLSPLFLTMALIYTLKFMFRYGSVTISQSPQIMYLSTGFWMLVICCLCKEEHSKGERRMLYIQIIVSLACSLIYGSRGWIIQSIILLCLFISKNSDDRKGTIKKLLTVLAAIVFVIAVFALAMRYFPERITYLVNKLATGLTSRTWQYDDLFSQYTFFDFLIGRGTFATYNTTVYGVYRYFDNTFINLMFRYGVLCAFSMFMFIVTPMLKLLKRRDRNHFYFAAALFLWLIGLCGVSVYNVMGIDLKSTLMFVAIGRALTMCYSKPTNSLSNEKALLSEVRI